MCQLHPTPSRGTMKRIPHNRRKSVAKFNRGAKKTHVTNKRHVMRGGIRL